MNKSQAYRHLAIFGALASDDLISENSFSAFVGPYKSPGGRLVSEDEKRSNNRNKPCECGSGLKAKKCHHEDNDADR